MLRLGRLQHDWPADWSISAGDHQALALDSRQRIWTWGQVKHESKKVPALLALPDGLPTGFAVRQISVGTGAS